jgi:hypothetical protein
MLDFDLNALDSQRLGRMGELVIELELLARGWMVGNFNATTMNNAGWDLFAVRGDRSVKIRVKAKRPGNAAFRWSAREGGAPFANIDPAANDDFVAAVSFNIGKTPDIYIVPTATVAHELTANHAMHLAGRKRNGGERKNTNMRILYLDSNAARGPAHGYLDRWAQYHGAWTSLLAPTRSPLAPS